MAVVRSETAAAAPEAARPVGRRRLFLVLAGLYLAGLVKLHRAGNRWPWQRPVSWLAGGGCDP